MSKTILLVILGAFAIGLFSGATKRPFPKRLLGYYYGKQASYELNHNNKTIVVPASQMTVKLSFDELLIQSPDRNIKARYEISAPTKQYYALKVFTEEGVIEHWELYRRGKRLIRKAHAPRPETVFSR